MSTQSEKFSYLYYLIRKENIAKNLNQKSTLRYQRDLAHTYFLIRLQVDNSMNVRISIIFLMHIHMHMQSMSFYNFVEVTAEEIIDKAVLKEELIYFTVEELIFSYCTSEFCDLFFWGYNRFLSWLNLSWLQLCFKFQIRYNHLEKYYLAY